MPTAVAKPVVLIVATVEEEEFHVAVLVRFWVVPSLKVPLAVNCWVFPTAIEGFIGVTLANLAAESGVKIHLEFDLMGIK